MTRPAKVQINLTALRRNFSRVRKLAPGSQILSVVKADAYGHGITRIATALDESDAFGVACIEEAMQLREAGITSPILLLEGPFSHEELTLVAALKLDIVIHDMTQISMIEQYQSGYKLPVWLKIDTGMHRLGFQPETVKDVYEKLQSLPNVKKDIVLMSHFADAGNPDSEINTIQSKKFQEVTQGLSGKRSMANSAGIISCPESHYDYVRPGLMLYGISPVLGKTASDLDLQPVMTLSSKLIAIKEVSKGQTVGYGAEWTCPETMPVGIVAIGYGDGYPRHARSGSPVIVNGQPAQVIGNPSMDMITVDLRNISGTRVGDPVELWGEALPIEQVAEHAGTITYELVSGIQQRLKVVVYEQD
jgi:alanine racemase